MTSLKHRLSLGLTLTLIILLVLQWALVSYGIQRLTEKQLIERLQMESESLLGNLTILPDGSMMLDEQAISSLYRRAFSGRYYRICRTAENCIQSRSLWDESLAMPLMASGRQTQIRQAGPQSQQLYVMTSGYIKRDQSLTIAIAEDIGPMRAELRRFQWLFTLVSATGLLLLLAMQWWLVGKALSPLKSVRRQLLKLNRGEAETLTREVPEEIEPVIAALNQLLTTLSRKTQRSRVALGNLAHALKSRLTLLNQIAEQPALGEHPQLQQRLQETTQDLYQIIERELKRARLLGAPLPGKQVDLPKTVADLCRTMQRMHAEKVLEIDWRVDPQVNFAGDREDLMELLGNLLDNASKWCQKKIQITVETRQKNQCEFIIEDDGPGCAESDQPRLTERGFRADESMPGSGLGLAIVHDIVDSYKGQLHFSDSPSLGGLKIRVVMPGRP
ncbi:Sensor protein PhoQ [Methylophaga frappieri]|uniref:histidine kinase n=1 Tax=Methylophaga frappieri (strain ATCC BAA-2434 / DSM 25690 / JAM7) TaxID=754477 RepID=I1YJW0_METFJ|nr:sensor histidine kinase [Methylophaga frappieri]AFJ03203.1 Sensor protein PhoQ [Methylophaga frappieri]